MPRVTLRGQSCGAIISGIMALGMAMGRDKPEDSEAVLHTIIAARTLCDKFETEFASCNCEDVQHHIFGRSFSLIDPKEGEAFSLFLAPAARHKNPWYNKACCNHMLDSKGFIENYESAHRSNQRNQV